jgi:hypothetical protein
VKQELSYVGSVRSKQSLVEAQGETGILLCRFSEEQAFSSVGTVWIKHSLMYTVQVKCGVSVI